VDFVLRLFDGGFGARLEFVDAAADLALSRARRGFQPSVIDLCEHAVFASKPAVAEGFPVGFAVEIAAFGVKRGE
jgi:hypothetical protein